MGKFSSTVPNQNKLFAGIERLPRATFRGSEPTIRRAAGSWDHHQGVFRRGSGGGWDIIGTPSVSYIVVVFPAPL